MGALSAQGPALIMVIAATIAVGVFHQCTFAIPAMQRDITELKSGQAEFKSGQAELKSEMQFSQAEIKLMIQRLCIAMGKPECALPPNACA
jgi:hypothetical protein